MVVGVGEAGASISKGCAPVHVIQAAGTGFSHSWHPEARETLFDDNSSPADDLTTRFGLRTVSTYQVKYPASLGRFNALASASGTFEGTEAATYGESVALGREDAVAEMRTRARSCPATKYILIGYSQGAHLIGDVAAMAAAGEIPGVTADSIAAVALFADPGKAPLAVPDEKPRPARLFAPAPAGRQARNYEIVNDGGTGLAPERIGMAGVRERSFNGLQGKVLSLCNADDIACALPPDSPILAVSQVAARERRLPPYNGFTAMRVDKLREALNDGSDLPTALKTSGLGLADVPLIPQIIYELGLVLHAADQATSGEAATPPEQRVAVALLNAVPNLLKEGVTWPYLMGAVETLVAALPAGPAQDWAGVAVEMMRATHAAETLYLQLAYAGVLPRTTTGTEGRQAFTYRVANDAARQLARATGLDAVERAHPQLVASARLAGDFGPRHMSYYRLGQNDEFRIDGKTGYDYALNWMGTVVRGVADSQR